MRHRRWIIPVKKVSLEAYQLTLLICYKSYIIPNRWNLKIPSYRGILWCPHQEGNDKTAHNVRIKWGRTLLIRPPYIFTLRDVVRPYDLRPCSAGYIKPVIPDESRNTKALLQVMNNRFPRGRGTVRRSNLTIYIGSSRWCLRAHLSRLPCLRYSSNNNTNATLGNTHTHYIYIYIYRITYTHIYIYVYAWCVM